MADKLYPPLLEFPAQTRSDLQPQQQQPLPKDVHNEVEEVSVTVEADKNQTLSDSWRSNSACMGVPNLFLPALEDESETEKEAREARAIAICGACVVRSECLQEAFQLNRKEGVLGGMGEEERRKARRRWTRIGSPIPIPQSVLVPRIKR